MLKKGKGTEAPVPEPHLLTPDTNRPASKPSDIATYGASFLENILRLSGLATSVTVSEDSDESLSLSIVDGKDAGRLIGRGGATLDALQTLTKAAIEKKFGRKTSLIIDTHHYRQQHEAKLLAHAQRLGDQVLERQKNMRIKPMPVQDRRLVHQLFQNHPNIKTYSVGHHDHRCVVLAWRRPDTSTQP